MSKKLKKSDVATGKKLDATESTEVTSKLLDVPGKFKTYGPFSGSAVRVLRFDVKVFESISVPAALYEYVKLHANQSSKCLASHDVIRVDYLVGEHFWSGLSDAEKDMAKACVSHLCRSGALPVDRAGFGLKYPEFYCFETENAEQKSKQARAAA